jgi:hypothetical protein
MVKFVSPKEWYDWYDANREEIKEFKRQYDVSTNLGSYWHTSNPSEILLPVTLWKNPNKKFWHVFSPDYPSSKKEEIFKEDEIYIVTSMEPHTSDLYDWWIIYIPIPLYKTNTNISQPFKKECWWFYKADEKWDKFSPFLFTSFEWIKSFIEYKEYTDTTISLNYPRGGVQ